MNEALGLSPAILPPALIVTISFILGLLIGSFLNVVIYRLPLQLSTSWRKESLDFLGMEPEPNTQNVNVVVPAGRGIIASNADGLMVSVMWDDEGTGATGTGCGPDANVDLTCYSLEVGQ